MSDNKKILLSGKLAGTRTFSSELEQIEKPDEIETFLLYFSKFKIDLSQENTNETVYIDNESHLTEINEFIINSKYIGLFFTEDFSKLYLTTESSKTIIIDLKSISPSLLSTFISNDQPVKYAINSFNFIKWCHLKNLEIRGLYDIPTYIKLLTNDVDPFKTIDDYIKQYSTLTIDTPETIKSHFIAEFGNVLAKYIHNFDLSIVSRLINENSYYEGQSFNNIGNCTITLDLQNTDLVISSISENISTQFIDKAYIISPLNRIVPKFNQNLTELIYETYSEDLSVTLLNELYNNNIPVKLDYQTGKYIVTCKYKNFSNIISILTAVISETFYTLFDQAPEIHIDCTVKE